ncbi:MAG: hypothetical protein PQ964_07410 [Methanobacteriaceae archaeon]|jgi:fatty acid desaturase
MKDTVEIKTDEEQAKRIKKKKPKRKINKYGVYISIIFIVTGLLWYAINLGLIPIQLVIQQAGPIIIIILGILILIKSL